MGLVQAAWEGGRHLEVTGLLARQKSENPDLLGFEWDYWTRRSHQASRTISLPRGSWNYFPAFSGDGSRFVAISGRVPFKLRGKLLGYRVVDWKIRDAASGQVVATFPLPEGDGDFAVLDPDGSHLAVAVQTDDDASGRHEHLLVVAETATGRAVVRRPVKDHFAQVRFSPDGRELAAVVGPHRTGAKDRYDTSSAVLVWNAGTGAEIRAIPGAFPRDQELAISPDGRRIAALIEAIGTPAVREIRLWEVDSGREVASFPAAGPVDRTALGFSPDGRTLAAVAAYPAGDILHAWDVETARTRWSIPLRSQGLRTPAAFSPDGRRVACVLGGYQIGVWDVADGKPVATYQDDIAAADAIAFGRHGRDLLAADSAGTVKIWDTTDSPGAAVLDLEGFGSKLGVSPDARWIAVVFTPAGPAPWGSTPVVKLWDAQGRPVRSFGHSDPNREGERSIGSLGWSPGGDRIACAVSRYSLASDSPVRGGTLTVWDLDGKELLHLEEEGVGYDGASFGLDGARVAAVVGRVRLNGAGVDSGQSEARVWDLASGRVIATIPDCTQAVLDPRGRRLAGLARSSDGSWRACIWDAETGAQSTRLELPETAGDPHAESLAFSPDGRRLAASITPRTRTFRGDKPGSYIAVWDIASGKLRQRIPHRAGTVVFSPDGSRIAGVYGSSAFTASVSVSVEVGLWDAATGRQLLALKGHGPNTDSDGSGIAFAGDGRKIISAVARRQYLSGRGERIEIRTWDATPWTAPPDDGRADHR